jgi:hypothetical protein
VKIGLISDTHIVGSEKLPPQVTQAFANVDLILHAGDIYVPSVLDELEVLAPVLAARGNGDMGMREDHRLKERHVLTLEGIRLGLVHCLEIPWMTPERVFGTNVDIAVFGDTHVATIDDYEGTLLINPGSPTFPNNWERQLGTVAIIEIIKGKAEAFILQLR